MSASPTLNESQRRLAMEVVAEVRAKIQVLANDDDGLRYAYTHKVAKELQKLDRMSPSKLKRLKKRKLKAQGNACPECSQPLELRYSVADRKIAMLGYVDDNVDVIHEACDRARKERRGL